MNKKVFTLVVLFLTTAFMASAQIGMGTAVPKLPVGNSGDLYQLAAQLGSNTYADSLVLSIDADGKLQLDSLSSKTVSFGATLWCITVDGEQGGKSANYDFTNKAMSKNIAVSLTDTASLRLNASLDVDAGYLTGFGFSNAFELNLGSKLPVYTHFKQDSILVLSAKSKGDGTFYVGVKPFGVNQLPELIATPDADVLYFTVWTPAEKILTAKEFNTMLDTTKYTGTQKPGDGSHTVQLTFIPEKTEGRNLFSETKLEAVPSDSVGYVFLKVAGSNPAKFVHVDTTYANTTGTRYLAFAAGDTATALTATSDADQKFINQYLFKIKYNVSNDSLSFQVNAARFDLLNQPGANHHTYTAGNNYASDLFNLQPVTVNPDSLYVKLQDLTAGLKRITLGPAPANTKVEMGYSGCAASNDATTVATDLYTIQNDKGQYLAMPIYNDSINGATLATPMWVTIDANVEDPTQMPAYQWIVKQARNSTSAPVSIVNREYGYSYPSIQLMNSGITFEGTTLKASGFTAMPKAIKSDKYLGYKYVSDSESAVNTYIFRYLHGYNSTEYLGVTAEADDALLYVMQTSTRFELDTKAPVATQYGAYDAAVTDLVKLERLAYTLRVKDGNKIHNTNKTVRQDAEKRYALATPADVMLDAVFFLKTNNTTKTDKENFYALVDTATVDLTVVKAGVNDANLQVRLQDRKETRTSAFAISPADEPLYRKFNTLDENETADNNPDVVKFFRTNEAKDMLYEDALSVYSTTNGRTRGINYLGVKNTDTYPTTSEFSYAIYVDTAFVERPATPGAGIVTPKPQYLLAVGVTVHPDGTYCPDHGWNANCGHDVPVKGYVRGRYLANATKYAEDANYLWNNEWNRLVFEDAIHQGDTLYILKDEYANLADEELDFALNPWSVSKKKIALNNNLHKDEVFQFRLINDDPVKDFLIESENETRASLSGGGTMIAPMTGGWVKIQNGVPVISRGVFTEQAIVEAEIFNVVKTTEAPVANEEINTTEVSVIASNGVVIVKNAAGKKVAVSNILGKTLANTAITSDEASIAVPAGIVIVAVEGESAVKVVVK